MASWSTYSTFRHMTPGGSKAHVLSDAELEAVHRLLLGMMDDIHEVCAENGFRYVISGGAALGAVRHGGFIPWDDDIDVSMLRADYDRFRSCITERFPDKYYVQEITSCEDYDLNFMKVRLNGTEFCEFLDPEPEKAGLFIDIFPVENVAEGRLARRMQRIRSDGMQFICSCVRIRRKKDILLEMAGDDGDAVRSINRKAALGALFGFRSFRKWLLATERVLKKNTDDTSSYVAIPTGGKHFKGELYPRDWLFPEREISFEDRTYHGMNRQELYLTRMYGDYERIPPENERERHVLLKFSLSGEESDKQK